MTSYVDIDPPPPRRLCVAHYTNEGKEVTKVEYILYSEYTDVVLRESELLDLMSKGVKVAGPAERDIWSVRIVLLGLVVMACLSVWGLIR